MSFPSRKQRQKDENNGRPRWAPAKTFVFVVALKRGSPIPLLKTPSRKSNWRFHASRKITKMYLNISVAFHVLNVSISRLCE